MHVHVHGQPPASPADSTAGTVCTRASRAFGERWHPDTSGTAAAILSAPALWHAIFHPFCHLCCTPTPNHTPELMTLQRAFCMRESLNSLRICEQTFSIFLLPSIWKFGACTMHQSGPWIKIPKSRGGCHWIGRGSI